MGEEKLPEAVHRELLAETRDAIKKVKELKKSEDIQVFAVDAAKKLSNPAADLEAIGREPSVRGTL